MKRLLTIFLLLLSFYTVFAQKRAAKRIIKLANQEMNDFRYAYSIPLYKNYLQRGWSDSTVYFNLGECYAKVNQYDSALKYYTMANHFGVNTNIFFPVIFFPNPSFPKVFCHSINCLSQLSSFSNSFFPSFRIL